MRLSVCAVCQSVSVAAHFVVIWDVWMSKRLKNGFSNAFLSLTRRPRKVLSVGERVFNLCPFRFQLLSDSALFSMFRKYKLHSVYHFGELEFFRRTIILTN